MPYIGKLPTTGNFIKLDTISVVNGQDCLYYAERLC